MNARAHGLFEVWGIEIEYVIVDEASLDVRSIADEILRDAAGAAGEDWVEDVEEGDVGWSNELVSHVLELKNVAPTRTLDELVEPFHEAVLRLGAHLGSRGARLMPSGMHPWMQPASETRIWPHESAPIYRAYDALFDCHRHGWANLQSVHLNLPFADEAEFGRVMAATRIVLPLIPALAASSPVVDGRATGVLDNRLVTYRTNSARVPAMAGEIIPEPVYDFDGYRSRVFAPLARQLEEAGADPVLVGQEWTNARGAIARFDRMAIEIRLIDAQECPLADLAICAAVGGAVRALAEERWAPLAAQRDRPTAELRALLDRCVERGPATELEPDYVELFGADAGRVKTARELWSWLAERAFAGPARLEAHVADVLRDGTLAERLLAALGPEFDRDGLRRVYRDLCGCLAAGAPFRP